MAKQLIDLGSGIAAGDGDGLRVGSVKINENFDELYEFLSAPQFASAVRISEEGTIVGGTTPVLTLTRPISSTPDGTDRINEPHLRFQTDSRAYLNWQSLNGATQRGLLGLNASNTLIFYDKDGVHRIWVENGTNGGITAFNSSGASPVRINYHGSDATGSGGLIVHDGAIASNTRYFEALGTNVKSYKPFQVGQVTDDRDSGLSVFNAASSASFRFYIVGTRGFLDASEVKFTGSKVSINKDWTAGCLDIASPSSTGINLSSTTAGGGGTVYLAIQNSLVIGNDGALFHPKIEANSNKKLRLKTTTTTVDLDGAANLMTISGGIHAGALPTSNPGIAGRLWNDSGTVKVSAG